ncbi:MAG: protein kinase [Chloroflexi bacterium]|nr:protein kinase [Chloroflexota bacterium]
MNPTLLPNDDLRLVGRTLHEKYRIIKLLRTGGFGAVYLAEHVILHDLVAIKVLAGEFSRLPSFVRQFLFEARAMAELKHPNIVGIRDVYELSDELPPHFVMEYMGRGSLHDRLKAGARLAPDEVAVFVQKIAAALQLAHDRGYVHRDIKPSNILFDDEDAPHLADFGIAKQLNPDVNAERTSTSTGQVKGSPQYMSPEQALGLTTIDVRADQYSLGMVLYQMLSGGQAYLVSDGSTSSASVQTTARKLNAKVYQSHTEAHINGTPIDIVKWRETLPTPLSIFFKRALAKTPEERFGSMAEFSSAFARATLQRSGSQRRLMLLAGALLTAVVVIVAALALLAGPGGALPPATSVGTSQAAAANVETTPSLAVTNPGGGVVLIVTATTTPTEDTLFLTETMGATPTPVPSDTPSATAIPSSTTTPTPDMTITSLFGMAMQSATAVVAATQTALDAATAAAGTATISAQRHETATARILATDSANGTATDAAQRDATATAGVQATRSAARQATIDAVLQSLDATATAGVRATEAAGGTATISAQRHATATARVEATSTAQRQATADATTTAGVRATETAGGTATISAQRHATATARVEATSTAQRQATADAILPAVRATQTAQVEATQAVGDSETISAQRHATATARVEATSTARRQATADATTAGGSVPTRAQVKRRRLWVIRRQSRLSATPPRRRGSRRRPQPGVRQRPMPYYRRFVLRRRHRSKRPRLWVIRQRSRLSATPPRRRGSRRRPQPGVRQPPMPYCRRFVLRRRHRSKRRPQPVLRRHSPTISPLCRRIRIGSQPDCWLRQKRRFALQWWMAHGPPG